MTGLALLFTAALVVSYAAVALLIPFLKSRGVVDRPNVRSSHQIPTPRGGGLGIVAGVSAALATAAALGLPVPSWYILAGTALVAAGGALDDFSGGLGAGVRFGLYTAAAAVVVYSGGGLAFLPLPGAAALPLGAWGEPLAVVWIVAVTNIFNFLDGIDGFAGMQGLIAALGISVLASDTASSVTGVAIAGACVGFLFHNWHPARIFMGDVGSTALGFLLATLPWQHTGVFRSQLVFTTVLFLWFFLCDGVYTIVKRALRGERVWTPHRSHLYQRLAKAGMKHDRIVTPVSALALMVTVAAVTAFGRTAAQWASLALAGALFVLYIRWVCSVERSRSAAAAGTS